MTKLLLSTAIVLSGAMLAGHATAADLIVDEPAMAAATAGISGFYFEIYGGATLEGNSTYNGSDYDMDAAAAFGASFGMMTPVPGLAVELDVMKSGGNYSGSYDYGVENYSLMINGEYSVPVNDMFEVYGAVGVGVIKTVYDSVDYDDYYSGTGAGYQVAIGARAHITDGMSLFGELKYQNSFSEIDANGIDIQYPTLNALVGVRFAF
jgi:opacity protein-like surface antigen